LSEAHHTHRYHARCRWDGSTAVGYESHSRAHLGAAPPSQAGVELSGDPAFGGDGERLNPEQLVVLAASSCQLLSFLAVAARARIDVRRYDDDAEGIMVDDAEPARLTAIRLRPRIAVGPGASLERLAHLAEVAHRECYVANGLTTEVTVDPSFEIAQDYSFGDTDEAARRLGVLADIFDPASTAFLTAHVPSQPTLAVDLGCGPGHSTRLLARVTGATRTVGLDASESFVAQARHDAASGVHFVAHDVRDSPWPVTGVDLAYARLVLAHLREPEVVALRWLAQLAPGGLLALDELEWFHTDDPALARYMEIATALVAAHGGAMFAGPMLSGVDPGAQGRRRANVVREWEVPVPRAAALFRLNLAVWRPDPLVPADDVELEELSSTLETLSNGGGSETTVTWGLRQMVLEHSR